MATVRRRHSSEFKAQVAFIEQLYQQIGQPKTTWPHSALYGVAAYLCSLTTA